MFEGRLCEERRLFGRKGAKEEVGWEKRGDRRLNETESCDNSIHFPGKAYADQLYFNHIRKNRYRDNKSPPRILREKFPEVDEGVPNLPPIGLELLNAHIINRKPEVDTLYLYLSNSSRNPIDKFKNCGNLKLRRGLMNQNIKKFRNRNFHFNRRRLTPCLPNC
jgi:hypothetical protein